MLVYKYVSEVALRGILESMRMGFTHPRDFNDPYDRPYTRRSLYPLKVDTLFEGQITGEEMCQKSDEAYGQYAVCSFTRTHDNLLMWSHYADSHRGAVIALDAETANLTSESFYIPIQYGSVLYTKRPNTAVHGRPQFTIPESQRSQLRTYEEKQRLFLSKPLVWAYEEEIRVVATPLRGFWKGNETIDHMWKIIPRGDSVMYVYLLPPAAFVEIYVGSRFRQLEWLQGYSKKYGFPISQAAPPAGDYEMKFEPVKKE